MSDNMTGAGHPHTSEEAADVIRPVVSTIRERVLSYATAHSDGFIDEDLVNRWSDAPESSYRKRRTELVEENWIIDSGRTKQNSHGRDCVIWMHRQFVMSAPPVVERAKPQTSMMKSHTRDVLIPTWEKELRIARESGKASYANLISETLAALRLVP